MCVKCSSNYNDPVSYLDLEKKKKMQLTSARAYINFPFTNTYFIIFIIFQYNNLWKNYSFKLDYTGLSKWTEVFEPEYASVIRSH